MTDLLLSKSVASGAQTSRDEGSRSLYLAGAVTALVVILAGLTDASMMFFFPSAGATPGTHSVVEWFSLFQSAWFVTLRDMGLFNMITVTGSVVCYFALANLHRRAAPRLSAFALLLIAIGAAIYLASNSALPMLLASQRYTAATDPAQKALWVSAGQSLLAREDLTSGSFLGFFIADIAGLLMALAILRGKIFPHGQAWVGLAGLTCMLVFNVCSAFFPSTYGVVMPIFGTGGGLLSLVWYALIARQLLRA